MQRMLVQLKSSLFMTVTVMDITTCIIPTWLLSRFAVDTCMCYYTVCHISLVCPSLVTLCSHKSGRCAVELYHAAHLWYHTSAMASSALQH